MEKKRFFDYAKVVVIRWSTQKDRRENFLRGGGELSGVREGVVDGGVSQVVSQVLDGALSGHDGLDEEAEGAEHGEASVLDLLHLELSKGVWVVSQAQGVEGLAGVEGVKSLSGRASVDTVSLDQAHEDNLDSG